MKRIDGMFSGGVACGLFCLLSGIAADAGAFGVAVACGIVATGGAMLALLAYLSPK